MSHNTKFFFTTTHYTTSLIYQQACSCTGTPQCSVQYSATKSNYRAWKRKSTSYYTTNKTPRTGGCDLTGRPCARSTYTNSIAADGTTLFWYDNWEWYCRICSEWCHIQRKRKSESIIMTLCATWKRIVKVQVKLFSNTKILLHKYTNQPICFICKALSNCEPSTFFPLSLWLETVVSAIATKQHC